jgi:hypothetical protein
MQSEIVEKLAHENILQEDAHGEELELHHSIPDAKDRIRSQLEGFEDLGTTLSAEFGIETEPATRLLDAVGDNLEMLALYLAIKERADDLDEESMWLVLSVLSYFLYPDPREDGAPDAFIPLHGRQLPYLLRVHSRAIVFVWRTDCAACDTIRSELEDIFEGPRSDVGLFAVYGPTCPEFMNERYDVAAGPTTLFIVDGTVDARLLGPRPRSVIDAEVEKILNF